MYDLKNIPYLLKKAINLEDVSFNSCYGYTISSMRNLSDKCKELDLEFCKFQNKNHALQLFQKLTNLEKLDVSNTRISPETLIPVSQHLVTLILGCETPNFFKGKNYKNLILPNLKNLGLRQNSAVTDNVVSSFYKCFPSLENLSFEGCLNIKFSPVSCLEKCRNLKQLNISETDTSEEGFTYLATHLIDLEVIICKYCDSLTESGFIMAVSSLPKLKWFSVGKASKFTDKFFKAALKAAELRTQDKPLEITLDCYGENEDEMGKRCKLKKEENASPKSKNLIISYGRQKWYVDSEE